MFESSAVTEGTKLSSMKGSPGRVRMVEEQELLDSTGPWPFPSKISSTCLRERCRSPADGEADEKQDWRHRLSSAGCGLLKVCCGQPTGRRQILGSLFPRVKHFRKGKCGVGRGSFPMGQRMGWQVIPPTHVSPSSLVCLAVSFFILPSSWDFNLLLCMQAITPIKGNH